MQRVKAMSNCWQKKIRERRKAEAAGPAPIYDEDMGGHYDSGVYSRQTGHPGYFWVSTDDGMEAAIQTLRTISKDQR